MTIGAIYNTYSDAAIANILANHRCVRFMPGDYARTTAITGFQSGHKIEAKGAKFIAGSDTVTLFQLSGLTDVSIDELDMVGTRAGTGTVNTQHGLSVYDCQNLYIGALTAKNFKGRGVMMPTFTGTYSRKARNHYNNLSLHGNLMGLDIGGEVANEYSSFNSINASGNAQAVLCAAANVNFNGGNISDNVNGMEWVGTASNYGHGTCTGLQVNHNTGFSVKISDNNYGQSFANCHVYANDTTTGRIILQNSAKTHFVGGVLSAHIEVNAGADTRHGQHFAFGANTNEPKYGVVGTNAGDFVLGSYSPPSGGGSSGFTELTGGTPIGDMTSGGGIAAVWSGSESKPQATCARSAPYVLTGTVGVEWSEAKTVAKYELWGSNDYGYDLTPSTGATVTVTIKLQGWNGSAWDDLHTINPFSDDNTGSKITVDAGITQTACTKHRIWMQSANGGGVELARVKFYEAA